MMTVWLTGSEPEGPSNARDRERARYVIAGGRFGGDPAIIASRVASCAERAIVHGLTARHLANDGHLRTMDGLETLLNLIQFLGDDLRESGKALIAWRGYLPENLKKQPAEDVAETARADFETLRAAGERIKQRVNNRRREFERMAGQMGWDRACEAHDGAQLKSRPRRKI